LERFIRSRRKTAAFRAVGGSVRTPAAEVGAMVDAQTLLVPAGAILLAFLFPVLVTELAVRRGWAYRIEPGGSSNWLSRTIRTLEEQDRDGLNAGTLFVGTLLLALGVVLLALGTLLG
jgi:hypothetical protein